MMEPDTLIFVLSLFLGLAFFAFLRLLSARLVVKAMLAIVFLAAVQLAFEAAR